MSMRSPLAIYLRNHEAAARAGCDLFARVAHSHRDEAYAGELASLHGEVREDRTALRSIMRRARVPPDLVMGTAFQIGERIARLKPNGRLVRPSPLTPFLEVEALLDAVHAKAAGWWGLAAAGLDPTIAPELPSLISRAELQIERLRTIHSSLAVVLDNDEGPDPDQRRQLRFREAAGTPDRARRCRRTRRRSART